MAKTETSSPPDALLELQERLSQEGFSFEPIHYPRKRLTRDSSFWRGKVAPEDGYWKMIKEGRVAKGAANLSGIWALIESVQKPNYNDGRQIYYDGNDPLGEVLTAWRKDGRIEVPFWTRDIPSNSRFAVSADEIDALVIPEFARRIDINAGQTGLPRAIEFNVAGNLNHPEWGQTNTAEWFADKFDSSDRLVGGYSDDGGLAYVDASESGHHNGYLGFRLQVVLSRA